MKSFLKKTQQESETESSERTAGSNAGAWGLMRARSTRRLPSTAGANEEIPTPRPMSIRRISEVALDRVRSGMGLATGSLSLKRKSSMRKQRRATSKDDLQTATTTDADGEVRTSSARMSETGSHSPELEPVNVQCGGASCRGKGKRKNEDRIVVIAHLVHDDKWEDKSSVGFAAVFDGHGGERCVDHVSMKLATVIGHKIFTIKMDEQVSLWKHLTKMAMTRGIHEVDREFLEIALPRRDVSGACGVMVTVRGCEVTLAHVGDCRAIMFNPDKEPEKTASGEEELPPVERLTRDHDVTDEEEISRIRDAGGKIVEGRLNGVLEPTRAFGDADIKQAQDGLIVDPDTKYMVVDPGTVLVLVSDGITTAFSDEELARIVLKDLRANKFDPSHAAATICKQAAEIGLDDSSAVIMVFQPK